MTSAIYKSAGLYAFSMRLLYGRSLRQRNRALAHRIKPESSVVDLCCGPPLLYAGYLRSLGVSYTGVDVNPVFIKAVQKAGANALNLDLRNAPALPRADFIIMQGALYHFLPDAAPLVYRMLEAAACQVIISEPVRNLSQSAHPLLARLAAAATNPGYGAQPQRFDEDSLDRLLQPFADRTVAASLIANGREKLYVLTGGRA